MRVGLKIEKQWRQGGKMNVLPTLAPDDGVATLVRGDAKRRFDRLRTNVAEIVLEIGDIAPFDRRLALEEWGQRTAVAGARHRLANPVEDGRHNVDCLGKFGDPQTPRAIRTRITNDERHVKALVEVDLFAPHVV